MQKKPKPNVAVVFGIMHLVFGSLSVVGNLCCAGLLGGLYVVFTNLYQQAPPAEKQELEGLWKQLNDDVPGLFIFVSADLVGSLLLGIVLLIAGIGLLGVKQWGRKLSIGWAIVRIIFLLGLLVVNVAFVNPGMQRFNDSLEKYMERAQRRAGQTPPPKSGFGGGMGGTGNPMVDSLLNFVGTGINGAYAVVVLIFMLMPKTGRAFERYHSSDFDDWEKPRAGTEDYYDEDYQRRRRELEPPPEAPPDQPPPYSPPPS
jgi:hypothetical protein